MNIKNNINNLRQNLPPGCKLVAVSKTKPVEKILGSVRCRATNFWGKQSPGTGSQIRSTPQGH